MGLWIRASSATQEVLMSLRGALRQSHSQYVADEENSAREGIAKHLLVASGGGLVLISAIVLTGTAWVDQENFAKTCQMVFNALLPLLGTWVGTVLAYYFSKSNFESASRSVQNMVQATVDQRLEKLKVDDNMLKAAQVTAVTLAANNRDDTILLKELRSKLSRVVTRVPVLEANGAIRYVIHQSLIYRFIAEHGLALATSGNAGDVDKLTLADLVAYDDIKTLVTALARVPSGATVASAKAEMERIDTCQDIIVTQTGAKTEPMLGWLTNVDIGKLSKA
jgi:hypothetical protein